MTGYVVLSQYAGQAQLTGVYATEEIALQAADGHAEWVIPCDVLESAP